MKRTLQAWLADPSVARRGHVAAGCSLLGWGLLVISWLLDITGHGLGSGVAKMLALAAGLATLGLGVWAAFYLLRSERRAWGGWLLGLTVLAVVVGFAGLEHEVGLGYYTDEGHYLHRAQLVNSGQIFHRSTIYPHLLYYRDGFSLWLADLFPGAVAGVAKGLYGVESAAALPWLVLRWVNAALAVSTLIPVFLLAHRLAGRLAAVLAGVLIIFSAHYHDGFHVNICDVPSAVFAAWAFYWVACLAEDETPRLYLLAGLFAGLAAAAKYPAGVVATAIIGVWALHRWRRRDWHWGLVASGGMALAVFLALNPSLLVYPEATLMGERGLFFGVRQYSQGGWIGVMPSSNAGYYWQQLSYNFGAAVFSLAVVGCFGLTAATRRRLLELAVFPVLFWLLICSMNMVVVRNLFPLLPPLAIYLGTMVSGVLPFARRFLPTPRAWSLASVVILLALLPTVWRTSRQAVAMTQPSTRQLMSDWMLEHVPRGASLLKESYTPNFQKVWFPAYEQRFLIRFPEETLDDPGLDFALLASQAHDRFFRPEHQTEMQADWYRSFFAEQEEVHTVSPEALRLGPRLMLYRLRQSLDFEAVAERSAAEAFLPNPAMVQGDSLIFERDGQFALFKVPRPAGAQTLQALGEGVEGFVVVRDMANRETAIVELVDGGGTLDLPSDDKYFFYLYLQPGSHLRQVRWSTTPTASPSSDSTDRN